MMQLSIVNWHFFWLQPWLLVLCMMNSYFSPGCHLIIHMWQWTLNGRNFPQSDVSVCHKKFSNSIYGFMHCYSSRNKKMSSDVLILPQKVVQTWKGLFSNCILKFFIFRCRSTQNIKLRKMCSVYINPKGSPLFH